MKRPKQRLITILLYVLLGSFTQICVAQDDGFIKTLPADNGGLPPGAIYENGTVSHPISSAEENLHLLAGYYYRNPREWKRIYKDNRSVIRNPNSLPVGKTLTIHVGENWKPLFSYEDWFRLANRNGQWKPGRPWKAARISTGTQAASPEAQEAETESKTPPPSPEPKPAEEMTKKAPSPPVKIEPVASEEMPKEEEPPPPPPKDTPQPEEPEEEEEAAPAF